MIRSRRPADPDGVARHYDELDPFYRSLWGEHLHHGLWTTGRESAEEAALALVDEVLARARIAPGGRVCDIGCGYGAVTRVLAARGAVATGMTVSRAQWEYARLSAATVGCPDETLDQQFPQTDADGPGGGARSGSCPRFLLRDWLDNGLADDSFDAVLAIECLSHMADPARAVAEAWRVLKPGGRLVACVWLAGASPRPWQVRHLLRPICEEGRLPGLPTAAEYLGWAESTAFESVALDDVSGRVARTWTVCAVRLGRALFRPESWRYLLNGEHTERSFAWSVLRLAAAYRTGAMRYGILTGVKPSR